MDRFKAEQGTVFKYNSDLSGQVYIFDPSQEVVIPVSDLLEFVAQCYVAHRKIERIEQMSTEQLLADLSVRPE